MANWMDFSYDKTIRDFDYTRRSVKGMVQVLDSSEFEGMESDSIFDYLYSKMETVSFCDYLKRYIYLKAEIKNDFHSIPDEVYRDILSGALAENHVPWSLTPTTTRKNTAIKRWLNAESVRRGTVFLLGFALKMPVKDVSEFLTKVLKEQDFDLTDSDEVIYWYCLKNELPYPQAKRLLDDTNTEDYKLSEDNFRAMQNAPEIFLNDEVNLKHYLSYIRVHHIQEKKNQALLDTFTQLYDRCRDIVADIYNRTDKPGCPESSWRREMIGPADIESMLCSGIPLSKSGNLKKMTASKLAAQFQHMRMSRQCIKSIFDGIHKVNRFDIITLLFFIYAETIEPDWPAERFYQFVEEANRLLESHHMMGIYPVNPYEAFVLMCIVTDEPMSVYSEIWERSFET